MCFRTPGLAFFGKAGGGGGGGGSGMVRVRELVFGDPNLPPRASSVEMCRASRALLLVVVNVVSE